MDIAVSTGIDISLIAVFIITVIISVKKGLIKSLIGLVGNLLAAVAALVFSAPFGSYISTNFLFSPMRQWMVNMLSPTAQGTAASISNLNFDELFSDMPKFFSDIISGLGLNSADLAEKYNALKVNGADEAKSAIIDVMVTPMADLCGRIIAFIVIFVLALIAIRIIVWLLDFIVELPVLRQLNKLGGGIIGALNGVLIVCLLAGIISASLGYVLKDRTPAEIENIEQSTVVYKTVNSINPVKKVFDGWK